MRPEVSRRRSVTMVYRDGNVQPRFATLSARHRALKRALIPLALLALVLGTLAAPATAAAYPHRGHGTAIWLAGPADGVGDSPIMP
jgi:hypothetical protein